MSPISQAQLQAEDAAYVQQAQQTKEKQKPLKPQPTDVFMMDVPSGHVPDDLIHSAISAADNMRFRWKGAGWYGQVRDAVTYFFMKYSEHPGANAFQDAVARLILPLLGYSRMLNIVHGFAHHAQKIADEGIQAGSVRFADVHSLGERTGAAFIAALKIAHHELPHVYISFIAGTVSESYLDAEIRKDVHNPDAAKLLTLAASVLKDGGRATHTAIGAGASSTDDLMPRTTRERMGGGPASVHLRAHPDGGYSVVSQGPDAKFGEPEQTRGGES
jgi:hypothetical protein